MILRAALILLLAMVALRVLGRWRRLASTRRGAIEATRKCPACGAYVLAGQACPCGG